MKRYNELEKFTYFQIRDESSDEGYCENWWPKETKGKWVKLSEGKKELILTITEDKKAYLDGEELFVKDLLEEEFLFHLLRSHTEHSSTSTILKVINVTGRQRNKDLFRKPYAEEDKDTYFDEDCPECQELLEKHEDTNNIKSGFVKSCSNWDCDYKTFEQVSWKPFNEKKSLAKNSSDEIKYLPLDEMRLEWIKKVYPFTLVQDKRFRHLVDVNDIDADEDDTKKCCENCGSIDSYYIYGVGILNKDKIAQKELRLLINCDVCHGEDHSLIIGSDMFTGLANLLFSEDKN